MRHRLAFWLRRWLLRATSVALACNFIVPAGYMPAALADGGPFALCGFGLVSHAKMSHGSRHGDHSDADGDAPEGSPEDAWKYCPLGALSASSAIASDFFFVLEYRKTPFVADSGFATVVERPFIKYRSRAPPFPRLADYLI